MTIATADAGLLASIRGRLEEAGAPLSASALKKALGKAFKGDAKALTILLDEQARQGLFHRFEKGKSVSYGLEEPEAVIARAVLGSVSDEPVTWAVAKKATALKGVLKLVPAADVDKLRAGLVRDGRLYEWPKLGARIKQVRYSTRPADPADYLDGALAKFRKELRALAAKLAPAGVTPEQVERSAAEALGGPRDLGAPARPTPPEGRDRGEVEALVLDRMARIDPAAATGAPVLLAALRRALEPEFGGKGAFDEAILGLADRCILALHRHDYPGGLAEAERDALIPDGRGGYYLAISRRAER